MPARTQAKAPEAEKRENRYLRAARIILETGEGLDRLPPVWAAFRGSAG